MVVLLVGRGGVVEAAVESGMPWMLVWCVCGCSVVACITSADLSDSFNSTTAAGVDEDWAEENNALHYLFISR